MQLCDAAQDICKRLTHSSILLLTWAMAKSKSAATGKGANRWPKIQQKRGLAAEELHGQDIMQASSATPAEQTAQVLLSKPPSLFLIHAQVQGCLSVAEAARFVETAARIGFQHQSSRGAAYGEVSLHSGDHRQPRQETCLSTSKTELSGNATLGPHDVAGANRNCCTASTVHAWAWDSGACWQLAGRPLSTSSP